MLTKVCPHCSALLTEPFVPLTPVQRLCYEAIKNYQLHSIEELEARIYGKAIRSKSAAENTLHQLRIKLSQVGLHIARSPFRIVNNVTREVITKNNPFVLPEKQPHTDVKFS